MYSNDNSVCLQLTEAKYPKCIKQLYIIQYMQREVLVIFYMLKILNRYNSLLRATSLNNLIYQIH